MALSVADVAALPCVERDISDDDLFTEVFSSPEFMDSPVFDFDAAAAPVAATMQPQPQPQPELKVQPKPQPQLLRAQPCGAATPPKTVRPAEASRSALRRSARQQNQKVREQAKQAAPVPIMKVHLTPTQPTKHGVKRPADSTADKLKAALSDDERSTSAGTSWSSPPASPVSAVTPKPRQAEAVPDTCLRRSARQRERLARATPTQTKAQRAPARPRAAVAAVAAVKPPTTVKFHLSEEDRRIPHEIVAFEDEEPALPTFGSQRVTRQRR